MDAPRHSQTQIEHSDRAAPRPDVAIVVVNFGRPRFLQDCILSVLESNFRHFELILTDYDPLNRALRLPPDSRVRVIRAEKNLGFAEGCNVAYQSIESKPKYLVLLNNDIRVAKDWLESLVQFMEANPKVGCAQSLLLDYLGQRVVSSGQLIDRLGNTYTRKTKPSDFMKQEIRIFYPNGASLIVRTSLLKKIGLFDPDFFMYYEDVDLGWKTWLTGADVAVVVNSIAYHVVGGTTETAQQINPDLTYHAIKNHFATILKNYQWFNSLFYAGVLFSLLMARIVLDSRKTKDRHRAYAYIKATVWSLLNSGDILRKRRFIQSIRCRSDNQLFQDGFIMNAYWGIIIRKKFQLP